MGGNAFYSNAEAYAFEILQQKLIKEAQRSFQQTILELSALKSFLGQGQLIYCIPFGGLPLSSSLVPFPYFHFNGMTSLDPCYIPDPLHPILPSAPPPPPPPPPPLSGPVPASPPVPSLGASPQSNNPATLPNHQMGHSVVQVNVKNAQSKIIHNKSCSDECNVGKDGIDVTIDLREYLPAEISLDVDERVLEIRANHIDAQGRKTFSRRYDLPACIILDSIRYVLSHDGFLLFSAAWCKME